MKSLLEETKREIIELLDKCGFPTYGVNIHLPDKIYVEFKRDDMPEGEIIHITIRRSEHSWNIIMPDDDKLHKFKDDEEGMPKSKEKMLKFLENKLQELVKCVG